jgi:hypothetical protein
MELACTCISLMSLYSILATIFLVFVTSNILLRLIPNIIR